MSPRRGGPVGVAMLGAAHTGHAWAYAHALSQSSGADLVAIHDRERKHTSWICSTLGVPWATDAEGMLAAPEVEAVVVCSANADHRRDVELAASMGKHVFCEKPIATTLGDAEAMIAACAAAGVQLHLAFPSRFLPQVSQARAAVRDGRLGRLVGLVGANRGRPPLPPDYPPWITDAAAAGGGALLDHSVHVTDAMRHVSGLEVSAVSAEAGELLWACGVDDVAVVSLRFDSGAVGSVDPSWSVPADNPWDYDFSLRIVGAGGSLDINGSAASLHLVSTREGGPRGLRHASFGEDADLAMIESFVASVRTGAVQEPCATGEDGLRALEVALAAYRSVESGSVVELR